jgi:hypothetical protein
MGELLPASAFGAKQSVPTGRVVLLEMIRTTDVRIDFHRRLLRVRPRPRDHEQRSVRSVAVAPVPNLDHPIQPLLLSVAAFPFAKQRSI